MKPNPPHGGYPTPREHEPPRGPYDDIVRAARVPSVTRAEAERYWSTPGRSIRRSQIYRETLLEAIDNLQPGNELVVRCRTTGTTLLVRPTAEVLGR